MARPNLSYLKNLVLFLVGLPCGALTGLAGMSASVLARPLLGFLLGLRAPRLNATALLVTCIAAVCALLSYAQHGAVQWLMALVVLVGQTVGATLGQRGLARTPALVRQTWLWALLVSGLGLLLCRDALHLASLPAATHSAQVLVPASLGLGVRYGAAFVAAVVAGILSALTGFGGALIVPVLLLAAGLPPRIAQGTAIAALLLASLPGALLGSIKAQAAPQAGTWMGLGAVIGGLIGAYYAFSAALSGPQLVFIYGVLLALLGVSLLWRTEQKEG